MKKVITFLLCAVVAAAPASASVMDDVTSELQDIQPADSKIITIGNVTLELPLSWETLTDSTVGEISSYMFSNDGAYIDVLYTGSSDEYPYVEAIMQKLLESSREMFKSDKYVIKEGTKEIEVLGRTGYIDSLVFQDDDTVTTEIQTIFTTGDGLIELTYNTNDTTLPYSADYTDMINNIKVDGEPVFMK